MADVFSSSYGLVVRFKVRDGHREAFDGLIDETLAAIQSSEPGTLAYIVHQDEASNNVRMFYELYRDREAFEEHQRMPHVQRFLALRVDHLNAEPEVWRVTPTVGVVRADADPGGS